MQVFRVRDYAQDDIAVIDGEPIGEPVKLELSSEWYARRFADADVPLSERHVTERWIYFYAELNTTVP